MRFGEAIGALLAQRGVDTIFGIPGVHTLELFRNLDRHGITPVVPRHEQGAGFMADGYTRITGAPGVCFLVTGPGVLNALTPIAQAWHDSMPMLVIASTVESSQVGKHAGTLHDTPDIAETLRGYTLLSRNVSTIDEFVDALDEAYARWATERPRPVYIGVPRDILEQEVELPTGSAAILPAAPAPSAAALDRAVEQLTNATAPVIIAGGGCRNAAKALVRTAEALDAPIILTANSKALVAHDHPLNTNVSTPFSGTQQMLEDADLVLAVGTELSDFEYLYTGSEPVGLQRIIRVDLDPGATHDDQSEPAIVADADIFLAALAARLEEAGAAAEDRVHAGAAPTGAARAEAARSTWFEAYRNDPYRPWIEALKAGLPANTIITADSAQLAYQSHQYLPVSTDIAWLSPYGYGTLGPAVPMAVGAALAAPERPVLALAGDGSSLFTIAELATAADIDRQLTVVLWLNAGYKEIEVSFERTGITPTGVATSAPDFASIARGLGATPVHVSTPEELTRALTEALAAPETRVILVDAPNELRVTSDS